MAEELEAGTAYLQLMASARDLQGDVDRKVKKVKAPDILAKIDADISSLEAKASKARETIASIRAKAADPQIGLDISALEAKAEVVRSKLDELRGKDVSPKVTADITAAEAQLGRLTSKIDALEAKRASVKVDADVAAAQAQVDGFEQKIRRLQSQRATVTIAEDGAAATAAALDAVDSKRKRVNGSNATVSVAAAGGAQASGMLGAIVAGLAAVASIAPAAGAALAGALAVGSSGGQALGAVKAGFSGISDAIKSVEADQKSAATASGQSASSQVSSANQIAGAQASLTQAVTQANRAAITGGQQVADASLAASRTRVQGAEQVADAGRALARAQDQADRASITSGQQVAAARRAVADAAVSSAERTAAAERSLGQAQQSVRYAQEALTDARRDAVEANEDLKLSLSGTAIAERRAQLTLEKARKALASGSGDKAELQLDVDEAVQNLAEVQERYGDLKAQQAAWAKSGVEGNAQVVSATRSLASAQDSAQDAARNLTKAQTDGARAIADATTAAAQAQQQAAWSQIDAQQSVADASVAAGRAARNAADANIDASTQVARAQQSAAWAQQDAATGVTSAQRALQDALASTAGAASTAGSAGKKSAYDLSQLTPAGREYVRFWEQEWKPAMQATTDAVAGELLPRIETAQRSLISLQPLFAKGLAGTGSVIGDLAIKGGQMVTSGPWRADFANVMTSNNRALTSWGNAGLDALDSTRALTVAGLPLSEQLARTAEHSMQVVDSFLLEKESTGELGQAMQLGAEKAGQLVSVGGALLNTGYQLVVALQPVGEVVLDIVGGVAQLTGEFIKANPQLVAFLASMGIGVAAVNGLAKATVALQASYAIASGGMKTLATVASTVFVPSNLAATRGMQAFTSWGQRAGLAASTMGMGLTGSARAGEVAGSAISKTTGFVGRMASSLPILGAATIGLVALIDGMTVSTDEASDALAKGGKSAADMRAELAQNDKEYSRDTVNGYISGLLGINTTSDEAAAALDEQRASMSNLERAQSYATQAQNDYDLAVKDFGAQSPQAIAAMGQLQAKTRDVEIAQIAVREKVDLATAAVLYQRDQLLGALDANLRARQAAQQLSKDQQGLADAIKGYGATSQQAQDASLQLESSQLRAAQAARDSAGGQGAYVQSIRDMIAATKGDFTPTLAGLIQSLDWAGLSAAGAKVQFNQAGQAVATFPNGKTVVLDANASPAIAQINFTRDLVNGTRGTIGIDADPGPAVATVGGFKLATDATTGVVTINGNITPADQQRLGIQAKTDGTTGTMWIDGNPVPCDGKLNGARISVDRTTGVMSIDANRDPADAQSRRAHDAASAPAGFTVGADYRPAGQAAEGFWAQQWREISAVGKGIGGWFAQQGREIGALFAEGGPIQGRALGGLVAGYATGGRIPGYPGGGLLRGPGTGTSDSILGVGTDGAATARVSAGEYVVREKAVRAVGVPALDAINGLRGGGLVGLAAGGTVDPATSSAAAAPAAADPAAAAVVAPVGDPAAAAVTADATDALTASMTAAAAAAALLDPALAAVATTQATLVAPATDAVTLGQQNLVAAGVLPLVGQLVSTLFPTLALYDQQVGISSVGANTALQGAQTGTQLSTTNTAVNTAANTAWMTNATTGASLAMQAQLAGLRLGQDVTQASTYAMAANNAGQNNAMISSTGFMSGQNQGHLAALRGAQGATAAATTAFADGWQAQLGRTVPDSANPIRWVMNFPLRSLTDAWNNLDGQFALNKHVNPVLPGFAAGGDVSGPGGPTSDKIPALLSDGEFVVREAIASRTQPFLEAFNAGQPEAIHAAGGFGANPRGVAGKFATGGRVGDKRGRVASVARFAAGGPVETRIAQAKAFAASMNGKPYIWGGTGPAGMDCSGLVGAVTHVLRGESPFAGRLGVARSQPWSGFRPGLGGQWATGYNATHTAGTLAGTNIESSQTPIRYPGAHGADSPQFTGHAFLPEVGGVFASGGAGGGIDIGPIIDQAFAKAYKEIADVPQFFGPSAQVGRDQGVAKFAADQVKGKATEAVSAATAAMSGGGGGVDITGIAGPVVDQVRQVAARYGWGDGAEWDAIMRIVAKESSWNPNAASPVSTARGLFQKMTSLNGPVEPTPAGQANWGLNYIRGRYGDPVKAWAFHQAHNYYDQGGTAVGRGVMMKDVIAPERVLNPVETRSYNTLEQTLGRNGMKVDTADLAGSGPVAFPDSVRLEATGLRLDGDGLLHIIDGHLVGLADAINDGSP